jgi:23S rRNA (adenine1618-N6)-methyltransferase
MRPIKKEQPKEKPKLHPRNKNLERYDFKRLIESSPELAPFVKPNIHGEDSVDFNDTQAVKVLNIALLLHQYGIIDWNIPEGYICPPLPGRADYIHHVADFLCRNNYGKIPKGPSIKCLDIGVGASCIYPIIGCHEYGWSFIGSDIDPVAIESANQIIASNPSLEGKIECKLQTNPKDYFYGIIRKDELIDLSICDGGEEKFIRNMILQSKKFASNCFCFSTLVSKESNLKSMYHTLDQVEAFGVETIPMGQGNKASYIVVWTFLTTEEQNKWKNERWKVIKT